MAQRSRDHLRVRYNDGERPSGSDFSDLFDSFINKLDDSLDIDENDNLDIPGGVNLKDTTEGEEGTLRFNGGQLQLFDGANWVTVGGGGGAFAPVDDGPHVAFDAGNVGIGEFDVAPSFRLEVNLGNNNTTENQVRFGNAVVSNGQGATQNAAQFSHRNHTSGNATFAVRQGFNGDVNLNAPLDQPITISHNRTQARIFVVPTTGQVVIAGNAALDGAGDEVLQVNGSAYKNDGNGQWAHNSDIRIKKDIKPFKDGLKKLLKIRPVRFRYNGKLNTNPDKEQVGIIGQEIRKIFPYMTSYAKTNGMKEKHEEELDEVLTFNGHALTYVMVNAIRELAGMVDKLKSRIGELEKQVQEREE